MRWRPLTWLLLSALCFAGAVFFWQLGDKWAAEHARPATALPGASRQALGTKRPDPDPLFHFTSAALSSPSAKAQAPATNAPSRFALRLSNTSKGLEELRHSDKALLLENALLDTAQGTQLPIPEHLRAQGDPGTYVVQSHQALDAAFRALLKQAGASIVGFLPNNAYLVRATAATAQQLQGDTAQVQAVLPWEPYFKLRGPLLRTAVEQTPMPEGTLLNVVLFDDAAQATAAQLKQLGARVVSGDLSPFGPVARVQPTPESLAALAALPGVRELELARTRLPANDLSRVALGISEDPITNANYLGLSGSNVLININDMGVDTNHPDLQGRVFMDTNDLTGIGGFDPSGHGTFEAGIMIGSGLESPTVTNAQGSPMPGVAGQFRGKAPGATLLSLSHSGAIPTHTFQDTVIGGFLDVKGFIFGSVPDFYLQQTAARANAPISNNGWNYGSADYDISAASYDAAVRDSLPLITGSQPITYVFAAGNFGSGNDDGTEGIPDSILSPATAKNVITVGSVEQFRNITNQVSKFDPNGGTNGNGAYTTNTPWTAQSDSTAQVSAFSSRGNVGIGLESRFGRFKPDVVAPGSWVVSTRSTQWDEQAYYNPTSHIYATYRNLLASTNRLWLNTIFVPANAVAMSISVTPNNTSPFPFPDLPIFVNQSAPPTNAPGGYQLVGTNQVNLPPDLPLSPVNAGWWYGIGDTSPNPVSFDLHTDLTVTNDLGNYLEVLSNLNNTLGPFYRYESGSSMAAAAVSGTLALMQEFFTQRMGLTNSPALMKALLINGAQPLPLPYDLQVQKARNSQGWGQVFLPNSVPVGLTNYNPSAGVPMLFFDQNPATALATGQRQTYTIQVAQDAVFLPLSITLVWTDPPGDPAAATKLVNDLDLVVTNLDTGDVYYGNDIPANSTFNAAFNTNGPPNLDTVNNVESVLLPGFGTNFSVTVVGSHVNVSAVTARPDNITQDYALVISSAFGQLPDALTLVSAGSISSTNAPLVTYMTNMFVGNPNFSGGVLTNQHVGANPPLLGTNQIPLASNDPSPWGGGAGGVITLGVTNQWHFFVLTNDQGFTNAAFLTTESVNLSVPRMGTTNVNNPDNATRPEPDIDLYVSTDPNLLSLDANAISNSYKSLTRLGDETVVLSNAIPGVYYVGVKSEDQMAGQFTFVGVFSRFPFSSGDQNGNQTLQGFVVPNPIPDASLDEAGRIQPGVATIYAIAPISIKVHRAIVTNVLTHELVGDLIGTLTHGSDAADLNNHTTNAAVIDQVYIYDDSQEKNVPGAHQTDGPRPLTSFAGKDGSGQWLFRQSDTSMSHIGVENNFTIFLEKQQDLTAGIVATLLPGACRTDFVDVPDNATNLTVTVTILGSAASGPPPPTGPISMMLCPLGGSGTQCKTLLITNMTIGSSNSLSFDIFDTPPLQAATYAVTLCNLGPDPATVFIKAFITFNNGFAETAVSTSGGPVVLQDDAVTYAYLTNLSHEFIAGLDIGMLINDPRISDLAITLVSPNGTRVLLMENRGGTSTNGVGTFTVGTNGAAADGLFYTNMAPFWSCGFEASPVGIYTPGAVFEGWNVLSNSVRVFPEMPAPWMSNNVLMLEYGAVSNSLPTTNSTQYQLSFSVNHAPYLVGTVGWWPFDGDGADIFGGHNGLLSGDVSFVVTGRVDRAFYGDGVATRMVVPACPDLDVGKGRGFSIEGWINPGIGSPAGGTNGMSDGFELAAPGTYAGPAHLADGWALSGNGNVRAGNADTGLQMLELGQNGSGSITTNFPVIAGAPYRITFAYTRNPDGITNGSGAPAALITFGTNSIRVAPSYINSWPALNWQHASMNFTPAAASLTLTVQAVSGGPSGMLLDSFQVTQLAQSSQTNFLGAPLVEWNDATNISPEGVEFWLSGLPGTNALPRALCAKFVDTNGVQFPLMSTNAVLSIPIASTNGVLTNGGWQHVALTYDAASLTARFYTNGTLADTFLVSTTNFIPRTWSSLYFGYHPAGPAAGASFFGGLDEFGLYDRALTDCEIAAIYQAGAAGKYSTNVLWCPLTNSTSAASLAVQVQTATGNQTFYFTNGLTWTNGPVWETDIINFTNALLYASTNGPATNLTGLVISGSDPNTIVDDFLLTSLVTNSTSSLLHFTDNTNFALIPIKYAGTPYSVSNFSPILLFSNNFENVTQAIYRAGSILPGITNALTLTAASWVVTNGLVTLVSNSLVAAGGTNCLALSTNGVLCTLPTVAGHRYQLTYTVRGPAAVSWWNGETEPLSRRAWDLLGGNNGAYVNLATNDFPGFVGPHSLYFNGQMEPAFDPDIFPQDNDDVGSVVEIADSANLKLTNSFTIEGWIQPIFQTNEAAFCGIEQIFFRGFPDMFDCAGAGDPYWLALTETADPALRDLHFHIGDAQFGSAGVDLFTTNAPIVVQSNLNGGWYHVAAVFDKPFTNVTVLNTNTGKSVTITTNMLRLYINGVCVVSNYTTLSPYADINPAYSAGAAIGGRSRYDFTQPFRGLIDELTIYGRALTLPEITAIAAAGSNGKADFSVSPALSLAKLDVSIDGVHYDTGYGDNARWTTRTVTFTADNTGSVLALQSELPGTLIDGITLTEVPAALSYQPENPLNILSGQDAFGVWTLEIWDNRAGITNYISQLLNWQLNITALPTNPPPVITLQHGIAYTNTLVGFGSQAFIVPVPQWALWATNTLEFAAQRANLNNALPVGVLLNTNNFPTFSTNDLLLFFGSTGTTNLTTNTTSAPWITPGQPYYLVVTNPNPVAVNFGYEVDFDLTTLTNCQAQTNFVGPAGIPRYFQFDVPRVPLGPDFLYPSTISVWLSSVQTNLTMVLSEHLPLPDLTHFDYISQAPSTNGQILMVVGPDASTNSSLFNTLDSTPFDLQIARWYIGVFNSAGTNVPFTIQACGDNANVLTNPTSLLTLIPLTNAVPYVADFALNNTNRVAPPGPPRSLFFQFDVTNWTDGILFELYGLSGNADLVLQRYSLPTQAPYFDRSFRTLTNAEQIVVRTSPQIADLRGSWYLGIINNETTNLAYSIRALTQTNGLLPSALPIVMTFGFMPAAPGNLLLQWNSIMGEKYVVFYTDTIIPANWQPLPGPGGEWVATTPLSTLEVPISGAGNRFYRVEQVATFPAPLTIQFIRPNTIRLSWPDNVLGETVQYSTSYNGPWQNLNNPVTDDTVNHEWVEFDTLGTVPRYYRLVP